MTEVIRRLRGHHEPREETAFHAAVERLRAERPAAPVMVELGSFWAYYSLWFHRALPGARLVLVEPDLAHLVVGRRNAESDGIEREVELVSVDGLVEREGLERIDLLLCDTQGAELATLEGARGALHDGLIRFLVVSTHHHSISGDRGRTSAA